MRKLYPVLQISVCLFFLLPQKVKSQCALLDATCTTYESRCAATGAIKVKVTGGSGNYKYKTTGPVNTNFTTSDSITGLSAGVYSVVINDLVTNCTLTKTNVVVAGSYQDPRFTLNKIDVSCDNSNNGSIRVDSYTFGRAPFVYTIVSPSPMGIGTNNSSGVFPNLIAGNYSIMMTDSCGGIQTRQITIVNYTWWIDSHSFTKTACDEATGYIKVVDSRGNISTVGGIPGFTYGIVRSPGDTIWSSNPSFTFSLLGHSNFTIVAKDACGIIKKVNSSVSLIPTVAANVSTYGYSCNFFSASLSVGTNFLTPDFCLHDSADVIISCNTTGIFTNLAYGRYCIKVHDACTDTTITRCFNVAAPPVSVNNTVAISDKVCASFTATITGQVGLTNPVYCLYDSLHTLLGCNSTGIFTGLSYQPYCIITTDGCRDTSISRCFNASPPTPIVPSVIDPYYVTCTNFGIHVGGDSLTAPLYCLYDSSGVLIICNNTGVFDSIPLGNYCVSVHDSCYDTTITRCMSVLIPVLHNDLVTVVSNKTCGGFTVTASSQQLGQTQFCLTNSLTSFTVCNSTGIFSNIPYGDYCIDAHAICPDTTMVSCFSVYPPLPAVGASVIFSNLTCTSFSAEIVQPQNLTSPTYCIYTDAGTLISCSGRGIFDNLSYGNYCIKITDGCYDTSITRCFSKAPEKISLSGTAGKSCSYGWASFNLNAGNGTSYLPVNVKVYNLDGSILTQGNYNTNSIMVDSIPGVLAGEHYLVVATDRCGNKDSVSIGSAASYFTHVPNVVPRCPSAIWASGSGNIVSSIQTNMGSLTVRIIKKNGVAYTPTLSANTVAAGVYTFIDLGPGTYILSSSESYCNKKIYDTVIIRNYQYPNLDRSSAYQCDVNGFSISAIATNGVGPFSYQIIGSQPTTPDITTAPQSSPIFTINNGSNYSLIRLRALDACGNATLGDASILPLAINGIVSTTDCFTHPTTLSVDSFFNSTYTWYKKETLNSADSVLLGSGTSYYIPTVLPSDTGIYVCYVSVNSGCINRTFNFHLGGQCWIILPLKLEDFKGQAIAGKNLLTWQTSMEEELSQFIIERKTNDGVFTAVGKLHATGNSVSRQQYHFYDMSPGKGSNTYRLKMEKNDHSYSFSNIVLLNNNNVKNTFSVYPNPVETSLTIDFNMVNKHNYNISLFNSMNQLIKETIYSNAGNGKFEMKRPADIQKGIYIIQVVDLNTRQISKEKLLFL